MAEYKVEFLPRDLVVSTKETQGAVNIIEGIINKYASRGWELDQVTQVSILEKPGCFATLLGAKKVLTEYNVVIFKK